MALKYKVGDRVRIKDLTWYDKNKSKRDTISFPYEVEIVFTLKMSSLCGQIVTISKAGYTNGIGFYRIREDCGMHRWTDEMIEGLVEEEPKFGTALNPLEIKSNANCLTQEKTDGTEPKFKVGDKITNGKDKLIILHILSDKYIVEDNLGECGTLYFNNQDYWKIVEEETFIKLTGKAIKNSEMVVSIGEYTLPEGYIFKDENGNIINTTKIILEKKKKEYPTIIEECCEILGLEFNPFYTGVKRQVNYKDGLLHNLKCLLIYRDAYWKLYGEEMGLGKPWEPENPTKHYIFTIENYDGAIKNAITSNWRNRILVFPTEEMRDAFYENFKELIESCKELL